MKKRIFSMLLTLCMVLTLLPTFAAAEDAWSEDLYVCGVQVTSENADNVLAGTENDGKVSYDPATDTLTLNNAALSPAEGELAIQAGHSPGSVRYPFSGLLTINLTGENTIAVTNSESAVDVLSDTGLMLSGSGRLAVNTIGNANLGYFYAINCIVNGMNTQGMIIDGVDVQITLGELQQTETYSMDGTGIYVGEDTISTNYEQADLIVRNGSRVTVTCGLVKELQEGEHYTYSSSVGLYAQNISVTGNGTSVTVTGGTVQGADAGSYGIYAKRSITVTDGGQVNATGGQAAKSYGLYLEDTISYDITVDNARLTAQTKQTAGEAVGAMNKAPVLTFGEDGYAWRTAAEDEFTKSTAAAYAYDARQTYVEIKPINPPIPYLDATGAEAFCSDYELIQASKGDVTLGTGWYAVQGSTTIGGKLCFSGDAHVILCDDSCLTVNGVDAASNLSFYGQSAGEHVGRLESGTPFVSRGTFPGDPWIFNGISVGDCLEINGGKVKVAISADGGVKRNVYGISVSETLIVNGGSVTTACESPVTFGYSGGSVHGVICTSAVIHGGTVDATSNCTDGGMSSSHSRGFQCNDLTVTGGTLIARGSSGYAATDSTCYGIGGNTITISGGTVETTGGSAFGERTVESCGIKANGVLTVSGGEVTATGGSVTNYYGNAESCGIKADALILQGGHVTAKTEQDSGHGLSQAPTLAYGDNGYAWRTAAEDEFTKSTAAAYAYDARQTYVEIKPGEPADEDANGFIPDYCVIKATAGEGGSITPSGRAAVLYGASKTFTITPNDGYAIADVKVDGKSVGAVKTYTFERIRGDHTIEAVFMKATGNPQTGVDVPFTDVRENDWFYEDVAYVYANNLMKGTGETTFSPAVTTTCGMIVTILYRLEGEPTVSDNCPFDDVKSGSYYEKAITWAAANEIVSGYGNGKFGPDDAITREQMAVILYRYTQYKGMDVSVGEDTNILSYNDAQEISEYAFSAMQWACGESILNGSDGNLMPQGNATRAQVAAILHRFCENILK